LYRWGIVAYNYPEIKNFDGLYLQANSFKVPDGAFEEASNVVISKDGIVSKRRGFYQYYDPSASVFNNLFNYQNKLLAVFANKISYFSDTGSSPNLTGSITDLTGATVAVTGTRKSRGTQNNNNFYFTTDNGVLKLEAYNSAVSKAGTPPATDLRVDFLSSSGPIGGDTQVAWRIVFGKRDANDNLLLGAPGDIVALTNTPQTAVSWSRAANVVTVTNTGHGLAAGMIIIVSNSTGATPVPSGTFVVVSATATTFTFADTAANSSGVLDYTATRAARLEASVPSEITSTSENYFVQIYRTSQSGDSAVEPEANFKLVDERILTSAEITNRVLFYNDEVDDILLGAELYTNQNSREGELQANDRPPLCEDITLYKNHVIYGNCRTRHNLSFSLISTDNINAGDIFQIKIGSTTLSYVVRTGVGNETVKAESVSGTTTITITYTAHGFSNGDTVYISRVTGTLPEGTYTVSGVAANTFVITSTGNSASDLDFQGLTNGTNPIFTLDTATFPVNLRKTAQNLVKAINRDPNSLVYARYTSGIEDVPGQMRLQAKGFTDAIYIKASTANMGADFFPVLPTSFAAGTQVYSRNDSLPHAFYVSKLGESEAVPLLNFFPAGARSKALLRVAALRDSLILVKEDGVFRVTGDSVENFFITVLDSTVFCMAPNSLDIINNQVIFLSNQGVCLVTENAVQIVSRKIDDVIQPIIGKANVATETAGVAYETERLYLLSTILPNDTTNTVVYVYNVLNDSWTTWDTLFKGGVIGPSDNLYVISSAGKLAKERKLQTKIDYTDQNFPVTVVSVASDKLSAVINAGAATPEVGDILIKSDVISKIMAVTPTGADFEVDFDLETNLLTADSVILYSKYDVSLKLAPMHGGLVGRMKQFAQMQIHFRDGSVSELFISFTGQTYGGSEQVTWQSQITNAGWGNAPWGFFPWGMDNGIDLTFSTQPAPVCRIYVPRFQQRNTFLQPVIEHKRAGEPLAIQAVSYAIRAYGERVSK
jgi:hypothetical protein